MLSDFDPQCRKLSTDSAPTWRVFASAGPTLTPRAHTSLAQRTRRSQTCDRDPLRLGASQQSVSGTSTTHAGPGLRERLLTVRGLEVAREVGFVGFVG